MDFKNVAEKYRPIPFWSWNDKLDTEETVRQVHIMKQAGMGGFFMHARGGLQTKYLGEEWFENIEAATAAAEENSMFSWAYDENGWPSGFGDGKVNGLGIDYQQKYLRVSEEEPTENIICKTGGYWFYYEVNPFYVDVLDKKVIAEFIKTAYEPYYERFKNRITGFFTDEPQISRNGIPWSFVMEAEYGNRYNRELTGDLPSLFYPIGDYERVRVDFWTMVTDLFSEAYAKQIYEWCGERNLKLTGHLTLEEDLLSQILCNGACMPHYEYFDIPGIDWLGRDIYDCLTQHQVYSAAEQLGKKQVLCETYALCGHSVSFEELKGIFDWHAVRGINLLCQHLEGYSIRGMRKRDYPPAMYFQQPWWNEYKQFVDAVSREGMILAEGEDCAEVLVIHPQTTVWAMYDGEDRNEKIEKLNQEFISVVKQLERKHILFHLGDETLIRRHGYVDGKKLVIGKKKYTKVINPCGRILFDSTIRLLNEFKENGGIMTDADALTANSIIDNENITYTVRKFDGCRVHFFVNSSKQTEHAKINVNGQIIDVETGELKPFSGEHTFYPYDSIMICENGQENIKSFRKVNEVHIDNRLELTEAVTNYLTLDKCDYYFDGELQEKNGYVLNICERANAKERPVKIHQDYRFNIKDIPEKLYLICETPEKFEIRVNSKLIDGASDEYVIDRCFKKTDISAFVKTGENIISFDCVFKQSDELYESIRNAWIFESEKNKLAYDMEIEPIYLAGNFGVLTDGKWEKLDRNAVRYFGEFAITKQPDKLEPHNIEKQGFPFFCGRMKCKTVIDVPKENPMLVLNKKCINAVVVKIGNTERTYIGGRIDLSDFGVSGRVEAELTLVNNLRNLMGPHHLRGGESYAVLPGSFVKERNIWHQGAPERDWDDNYCFAETGVN
ncbi:MAG: hypothetical protein ACI3X1_05090 [Eubacteriales bacterium]